MTVYRHTQVGTLVLVGLGATILFLVVFALRVGFHPVLAAVLVIEVLCLLLFGSLTVEVSSAAVSLWFGIGLIRRSYPAAEIRTAQVVRNRWYYGWGIRWIGRGWLFNVSGLDAVEIVLSNDKLYRIGTDEPDRLLRAIENVRGAL